MAAGSIVSLAPDAMVLDLAAAPGGKTTHIASNMQNQGTIMANEIHPRRVWDLAGNLERWGVTNALVVNETPERLAAQLGAFFDLVLVDAPCSGEGMFRKNDTALKDWSPDLVLGCAERQLDILGNAARLVRSGGFLLYSTCTFSLEENEHLLGTFLTRCLEAGEEFQITGIENQAGFQPGISLGLDFQPAISSQLEKTVRLYPHLQGAEGHFFALLQRKSGISEKMSFSRTTPLPPNLMKLFQDFTIENLECSFPADRLALQGNYVYLQPERMPDLSGLKIIHPGWWLGTFKKNRFEPSHALGMGLKPEQFLRLEKIRPDNQLIKKYLRGETIPSDGPPGWTVICLDGGETGIFPVGWGKRNQGILKNFYPRGLRWY